MPKSEASSPIAKAAQAEKTRERLRALIDGRLGTGADRSDLVRMAVQLIVEEVLEGKHATSSGANVMSAPKARPLAIATATGGAG